MIKVIQWHSLFSQLRLFFSFKNKQRISNLSCFFSCTIFEYTRMIQQQAIMYLFQSKRLLTSFFLVLKNIKSPTPSGFYNRRETNLAVMKNKLFFQLSQKRKPKRIFVVVVTVVLVLAKKKLISHICCLEVSVCGPDLTTFFIIP